MYNDATTHNSRWKMLLKTVTLILLTAIIIFIFFNSSETGSLSGTRSEAVTRFLNRIIEAAGIGFRFSVILVRKLAHFAEYALLGFWLLLTTRVYTRRILAHISWPLFIGIFTAVTDEFFQLSITGRTGSVRDVLIDFAGICAGIIAGIILLLMISWLRRLRRNSGSIRQ